MVEDAYEEHNKIDQLLAEMTILSIADEEFQDKLAELKETIEDHVNEEEGELFIRAEEILAQSRLQEMGKQIERIKKNPSLVATRGL
jgi:hemerythrin superfamily protein